MGKYDYSPSRRKLLEICYASACESLAQQRSDLRAIRSNASIVAAVSGLAGTLLFGILEKVTPINSVTIDTILGLQLSSLLALFCFAASIAFALRILLPTGGWKFEDSPSSMISSLEKRGPSFSEVELFRKLTADKEKRFDHNEKLMLQTQANIFFASSFAFAQIPFWMFSILSSGI